MSTEATPIGQVGVAEVIPISVALNSNDGSRWTIGLAEYAESHGRANGDLDASGEEPHEFDERVDSRVTSPRAPLTILEVIRNRDRARSKPVIFLNSSISLWRKCFGK